jgi:iron complex outermembrane receptor protein
MSQKTCQNVSCNKELSGIKVMIVRSSAHIIRASLSRLPLSAVVMLFFLILPASSPARDSFIEDTINISAVTVTARAAARLSPFTVVRIEPDIVSFHEGDDLATLLQTASLLYVKRYGNHGLASVSVRGMSGSHTLVTWNGLTINTPGNGYSDFAIIPMMASTSVRITSGGSDLDDLTGYIGGKVELDNDPLFGTGKEASVSLSAGSYNEYASTASVAFGGERTYARLGAWQGRAHNDFRFENRDAPGGPVNERRSNSAFSTGGIMSDMAYRMKDSQLSLHLWYNDSDRELPGPVTTVQQNFGERQTDKSFRGVMKYSSGHRKLTADVTTGGSYDVNRYFHEVPSNNGDNSSSTAMISARLGYRLSGKTTLEIRAGDVFEKARTLSYEGEEERNTFSLSVAGRSNPLPRLNMLLQVRQTAVTGIRVTPEFTAGASWMLSHNGEHLLKASVSRNTKLPCLNDLYWVPGGNPDLMPESAAGGETSWSFLRVTPSGTRNSLDLTLHASAVSNLIQWMPGASGLWNAENVRDVNVTGAEARAGTELLIRNWNLRGILNYAYTRSVIAESNAVANDNAVGRQLIYAPLNHANLNLSATRKWFRTGLSVSWESRRYTTSDNSEWLPQEFLADLSAGADLQAGAVRLRTEFEASNIFGTATESVRNYPMPLRTFKIKLTLTLSDNQKKDEKPY